MKRVKVREREKNIRREIKEGDELKITQFSLKIDSSKPVYLA